MEKFVHKETGEVVLVIGVFLNSKGSKFAQCLCDARLHIWEGKESLNGTISLPIPYEKIMPLTPINWDSIANECYPKGGLERQIERMREARLQSLDTHANGYYKQQFNNLIHEGVPEDKARIIAEGKKQDWLDERMQPKVVERSTAKRNVRW